MHYSIAHDANFGKACPRQLGGKHPPIVKLDAEAQFSRFNTVFSVRHFTSSTIYACLFRARLQVEETVKAIDGDDVEWAR
jgi:hypothetical protein